MMLSLDTAYRSFGGEVEASSTPTICRLPDSRRHQLSAIAPAYAGPSDGPCDLELALDVAIEGRRARPPALSLRWRPAIPGRSLLFSVAQSHRLPRRAA